jgi:site-specific DNA-cytosine methylase
VLVENTGTWTRWVPAVRRDLWRRGYASVCLSVSSADLGAPHDRRRSFVFAAHADREGERLGAIHGQVARVREASSALWCGGHAPAMGWRVDDGDPRWLDAGKRNRVIGEGVDQHTGIVVGMLLGWLLGADAGGDH